MATIIDALVVTLGLDASKFKAGSEDAQKSLKDTEEQAAHTAKELEARGKQAAAFFNSLKTAAVGFTSVVAAGVFGLEHLTHSFGESDAALGRMAEQLGVSTQELSTWQNMVTQAGGSAEEANATMSALALGAQQFNTTGQASPLIELLLGRGISPTGNAIELFKKLAEAMRGLSKADATNRLTNAGLPPSVITLLESSADVLNRMQEAAQVNVVSPEQAKNAQELQQNIEQLEQQFLSFGRTIAAEVIPIVLPLLKDLNTWLSDPTNRQNILGPITDALKGIGAWLKSLDWDAFWAHANAAGAEFLEILKAIENFKLPGWLRVTLGLPAVAALPASPSGALGNVGSSDSLSHGPTANIPVAPQSLPPGVTADPAHPAPRGHSPADDPQNPYPPPRAGAASGPDHRSFLERLYKPGPGLLDGLFGGSGNTQPQATPEAQPGTFKPILDLLGRAEGTDRGRGYNETMGYGKYTNGPVELTSMTLDQVAQVQKTMLANGASSTAVGRYQFLQDTLKSLTGQLKLDPSTTRFTPEVQDRLAEQDVVNRGGEQFRQGLMSAHDFMLGLSKEWASVANPDTGHSYYGQGTGASVEQTRNALRALVPSNNQRMAANDTYSHTDNRSTHETHVNGPINIHTRATDANQIARDIAPALRQGISGQVNTGLA